MEADEESLLQRKPQRTVSAKLFYGLALLAVALVGALILVVATRPDTASSNPVVQTCKRETVKASRGMVSTTNHYATRIGVDILKAGGNAFDAAAAVQFALALAQPQSTGIGGGCFIIGYKAKDNDLFALDGREEAPRRFNSTSFCRNPACQYDAECDCSTGASDFNDRVTGGHPVGVPGVISAVRRMLKDHGSGRLSLRDVMAPSIRLAREGFTMYAELHRQLVINKERMGLFEATKKLYYPRNGEPVPVGEVFFNPEYADTLEHIAQTPDSFYAGDLARDIVSTVRAARHPRTGLAGVMEEADLAGYRAVYRKVLKSSYRGLTVAGMSMPSSGGSTLALILNILSSFDLGAMTPGDAEFLHRMIDAQDIAWADRATYMADADWVDVPVDGLIDSEYGRDRAANFSRALRSARVAAGGKIPEGRPPGVPQHGPSVYAPGPGSDKKATTHFVVADEEGNVVSFTTTLEENLGSAVVVPGRGFLLNNELTDFEALPADPVSKRPYANRPEGGKRPRRSAIGDEDRASLGGKRPLSSMTPTIIFNKLDDGTLDPVLALGSPGGSRIIGTVLNALLYVVDSQMCISDAIDMPRVISQNAPSEGEDALFNRTHAISLLRDRGFSVAPLVTRRPLGYIEAVHFRRDENGKRVFEGAADSVRMPSAAAMGF